MSTQAMPTDTDYSRLRALFRSADADLILRCAPRDPVHQSELSVDYVLKVNRKDLAVATSAFEEMLAVSALVSTSAMDADHLVPEKQVRELTLEEDWLIIWVLLCIIHNKGGLDCGLGQEIEWKIHFELYQAGHKYGIGARHIFSHFLCMLVPCMEPEDAVMIYACTSAYKDHRLAKATLSKGAQMPSPGWLQQQIPEDAFESFSEHQALIRARLQERPLRRGRCGTSTTSMARFLQMSGEEDLDDSLEYLVQESELGVEED